MSPHVAFFGDGERPFALTFELTTELERNMGVPIGTLCMRVPEGHFRHAELVEIIRLALIGGGTSPAEAKALTDTYAAKRPLAETFPLATAILQHVWSGNASPAATDEAPDDE